MKKIKDKVKALELLQQRDSNPKITCQWIADQCGYSRKQIERLSAERKEKDTSAILTHGNTGRKPATTASDQEIRYLEGLKKTYPSITAQSGKTERLFRFIGAPFRFSGTLVKETGSAYSYH